MEARFFCVLMAFYMQGYTRYRARACKGVRSDSGAFESMSMIYDDIR